MAAERLACRLCDVTLRDFELERRLCSVCEEYAHQLGVRDDAEMDKIVAELMDDPILKPLRKNP